MAQGITTRFRAVGRLELPARNGECFEHMGGNEIAGEFEVLVLELLALDPGALNAHQWLVRLQPIAKFSVAQVQQISLVTKAQAVKASRLFLQGRLPDGVPR